MKQLFIICLNIPFTILVFLARISGRHEDEELIEKREALSRKERRKQMRAADPAVKLRAQAHDELRSRPRPGKRSPGGVGVHPSSVAEAKAHAAAQLCC